MSQFTIDASDFDDAARALSDFDRRAERALLRGQREAAQAVKSHVRSAARRHRKRGFLERGIKVKEQGSTVTVAATGPIAPIIVKGAKPHDYGGQVMPLHSGGSVIGFASAVQHPGFRGDPFFSRGVRAAESDIDKALEEAADDLIGDLTSRMGRR